MQWAMIVSMIIQGVSSLRAGIAKSKELSRQKEEAKHKSRLAKRDADAAARKADFDQTRNILAGKGVMDSILVSQSVSGARTDVGGPLRVRAAQWAEVELDNFLIGLEGRNLQARFKEESRFYHELGTALGKAAKNAFYSGHLGAGQQTLGTFNQGQQSGMWDRPSTTPSSSSSYSYSSAGFGGSGSQQTTWGHPYQR
jgi:hypothetical protein